MTTCFYCSSSENLNPRYVEIARDVARRVALEGDTVVFGGIRRGLMAVVAEAAQEAGAEVIGVYPAEKTDLANKHNADRNDRNILTDSLSRRKEQMIALSDRFVVLPGGYGTLDELFATVADIMFMGKQGKTIEIYNVDGIYDPLRLQLDKMQECHLLTSSLTSILKFIDS